MANEILYRNTASLLTCTTSLILAAFQQYHAVGTVVGIYVASDLFFTDELDSIIHHILAGAFIASVRHLDPANYLLEARAIVNMEISTVFLALNHFMKEKILVAPTVVYKINQYLFLLTFTKYRIWDYYWVLLDRESFPSFATMVTLWSLFFLDLYWFSLIMRKLTKSQYTYDPVHSIRTRGVYDPCFSGKNAS